MKSQSESPYIIGIDEAGRGPLAGPVAVGAVCIAEHEEKAIIEEYFVDGVRDSKKMTEKKREALFEQIILDERIAYTVAMVSAKDIDSFGIAPSIARAIEGVLTKLGQDPVLTRSALLLDGALKAPEEFKDQQTIIKGDEKEVAIALASVCAKVLRDRRMRALGEKYPQYGFEKHKGYGTKGHMEAIREHGMCEEHRRTFCKKFAGFSD